MKTVVGRNGMTGVDLNQKVNLAMADVIYKAGHRFVCRYVPRVKQADNDLTSAETHIITAAGLGIMPVQHVEPNLWTPTPTKGTSYGRVAGQASVDAGIVAGTTCWLDLEEVSKGTMAQDVVSYCNNWFDEVMKWGYTPGLYVGDQPLLNRWDLYHLLRFHAYWGAYNQNSDQVPLVRGNQMKQSVAGRNLGFPHQIDTIHTDHLGGLPILTVAG